MKIRICYQLAAAVWPAIWHCSVCLCVCPCARLGQ